MSTISVTNINDGDAVTAASVNNQVNTIVNDYNGSISASNLASNAVTTAKITDNNVTASKLAVDAIYLGSTSLTASVGPTSTGTSDVDVSGWTVTVTVPSGSRKIIIMVKGQYQQSGGIGTVYGAIKIKESTTVLESSPVVPTIAAVDHPISFYTVQSGVSAGSHTYKVAVANNTTGPTYTLSASSTSTLNISVFAM